MLGQNTRSVRYLQHKVAARNLHLPVLKVKHHSHNKNSKRIRKVHQENKINTIASETYTNESLRGQNLSANPILHPDFKDCECKFGKFAKNFLLLIIYFRFE